MRAEESLAYQSIKDVHTMNTISLTVEIGDQIESKLLLSPDILQFVPEWFTTKGFRGESQVSLVHGMTAAIPGKYAS